MGDLLNWGTPVQPIATRPFPAWTPPSLLNPFNPLHLGSTPFNEGSCPDRTAAQLGYSAEMFSCLPPIPACWEGVSCPGHEEDLKMDGRGWARRPLTIGMMDCDHSIYFLVYELKLSASELKTSPSELKIPSAGCKNLGTITQHLRIRTQNLSTRTRDLNTRTQLL